MSAISRMFESGKQVVWAASAAGFVYNSIGLIQSAALKWISHMDASEDQCQDNVWAVVGLATGTALTAGYIYKRFYAAPVDEKDRAGQMSDIFIKSICLLKAKEELSQVNLDEVTTLVKELGAYLQGLPHGKEIMGQVSKIRIPSIDGYVYRTVS